VDNPARTHDLNQRERKNFFAGAAISARGLNFNFPSPGAQLPPRGSVVIFCPV